MFRLTIGDGKAYKYLVGTRVVAIITPTRKKHLAKLNEVQLRPDVTYGVSPEEVALYILRERLQ